MSVKIRLSRVGGKKQPSYRVVVADSRRGRDSRSLETIGHYDPLRDPVRFEVDADRVRSWLERGALPSETVARLLRGAGIGPKGA